jgi:hypothetical protein
MAWPLPPTGHWSRPRLAGFNRAQSSSPRLDATPRRRRFGLAGMWMKFAWLPSTPMTYLSTRIRWPGTFLEHNYHTSAGRTAGLSRPAARRSRGKTLGPWKAEREQQARVLLSFNTLLVGTTRRSRCAAWLGYMDFSSFAIRLFRIHPRRKAGCPTSSLVLAAISSSRLRAASIEVACLFLS